MAVDFASDEDKYGNESFENDSDDLDSDQDSEEADNIYTYSRDKFNAYSKDFVPYTSSSDDDGDVIVQRTTADINTQFIENDRGSPKIGASKNAVQRESSAVNKKAAVNIISDESESEYEELVEKDSQSPKLGASKKAAQRVSSMKASVNIILDESESIFSEDIEKNRRSPKLGATKKAAQLGSSEKAPLSIISHAYESEISVVADPQTEQTQVPKSDQDENVENETDAAATDIETLTERTKSVDLNSLYDFDDNADCINNSQLEKMRKSFETPLFGEESARSDRKDLEIGDTFLNDNLYLLPDGSKHNRPLSHRSNHDSDEVRSARTGAKVRLPNEPRIALSISSHTPSSFSADDYAFHMNFVQKSATNPKIKNGNRKSWSFTNERMREIERQNQILLKKILSQKGTYSVPQKKSNTNLQHISVTPSKSATRQATAALNRKKQQRQIDLDNQVLKRKIEAIAYRRPPAL